MASEPALRTIALGNVRISLIRDGELRVAATEFDPEGGPAGGADGSPAEDAQVVMPLHVVLVQSDDEVVLLDTGLGSMPSDDGRGGELTAGLERLGLTPADVTRVVISHLHGDHIGGAFVAGEEGVRPAFPNARHHLPRGDWEWLQGFPDEMREQYLGMITALPALTLDDPDEALTPWLRSVGAAGHTPGHRCLVVEAGGPTFCYLADLVHDATLHFAEPERVTGFDDTPALTPGARRRLAAAAVAGDWLLAAAHAGPSFGHLTPRGDAWEWRPAD